MAEDADLVEGEEEEATVETDEGAAEETATETESAVTDKVRVLLFLNLRLTFWYWLDFEISQLQSKHITFIYCGRVSDKLHILF